MNNHIEWLSDTKVTPAVREEINWRAYMNFVNSGGSHGNDLGHWLQAEHEVLFEHALRQQQGQGC